ncbi:MAG: A/G-specific adenine glycosylase [Prolixibacteraceae bacterium]|nr:A/G-specific adenine glycosylase [Prolixibacteraceae bacterium]
MRDLPWRHESDPYRVWISEIILQQTRIDQGIGYYLRFIERFPNLSILAEASEDEILKMWQGLGYYSRARNLLTGARQIAKLHQGQLPGNAKQLKTIKGIGDYTAAAIASIAFNEAVPAIDGNVYRVLSRIFGIETPIDSSEGKKTFAKLAASLMHIEHPGDYNQALMEFGALHCKPAQPLCQSCPFQNECMAFQLKKVQDLPVKTKKIKPANRYLYYIVVEEQSAVYLKKRIAADIWKNLYDFPLIETPVATPVEQVMGSSAWKSLFGSATVEIKAISENIHHLLTHQHLHVRFIHVALKNGKFMHSNFLKIDKRNIFEWPVPKLIENYLNEKIEGQ